MEKFQFTQTKIAGLTEIRPFYADDHRGYLSKVYEKEIFAANGIPIQPWEELCSLSKKGVLRGLHFQKTHPQAKLVRVLRGEVYDVAVDLRGGSETYGKWAGVLLSGENHRQFMIPRGFAHGFVVLSETAEFAYKCDELYHPEDEGGIAWDDPEIGIQWPEAGEILLSEKDKKNPTLRECGVRF